MERQTGGTLFTAVCLASIAAAVSQAIGTTQQGLTTFYGGPQDNLSPTVPSFGLVKGSCGYGYLGFDGWPYGQAAAISPGNPLFTGGNQKGCGECIQVTCTSGCAPTAKPLTVVVTDTCDTCQPTQINVHALAFSQYFNSDFSIGQVQTIWQQVDCTPPGDIQAKVVDYRPADGTFIAVAPFQVAGNGVISNLEIQGSGQQSWQMMMNAYGAVWQASNLGSPPYSLRITGSDGTKLVATGAITQLANGTYPTGVQFGGVKQVPLAPPPRPQPSPPALPTISPPLPAPLATPAALLPPAEVPPMPAMPSPAPGSATAGALAPGPATAAANGSAVPIAPRAAAPSRAGSPGATSPVAPAPAPSQAQRAPAPAPRPSSRSPASAPTTVAAVPAVAPAGAGTTQLMLNSSLSGAATKEGNTIVNPAIMIAGRRLHH